MVLIHILGDNVTESRLLFLEKYSMALNATPTLVCVKPEPERSVNHGTRTVRVHFLSSSKIDGKLLRGIFLLWSGFSLALRTGRCVTHNFSRNEKCSR